jgi:hypothetical protein
VQTHRGTARAVPAVERAAEHAGRRPLLPGRATATALVVVILGCRQLAVADRHKIEQQSEPRFARLRGADERQPLSEQRLEVLQGARRQRGQ